MQLIDALERTFDHAQVVIGNIGADQLDDPTPCPEWTVRQLLDHTISVVAGLGAAAAGESPQPFVLGPDPATQFEKAAESALAAWRDPLVMDRIIDAGPGPMPGNVLASINLLDTATHTWDLAIATGQPAELPDDVAGPALEASRATISDQLRPGRFADEVAAPDTAALTDQLVAFLGRQPVQG
jgi:uncharacterized protein (TIGR03086 family)